MSASSHQLLWDILEEITGRTDDTESAIAIIKSKLRQKQTGAARPLTLHWLRDLAGRTKRLESPYDRLHRDCLSQLWTYINTSGAQRGGLLPSPYAGMDPCTSTTFQSLVDSSTDYPLRWAVCRIVLGLESQWWWLPSPLTRAQADELLWDIVTRYPCHADAWLRNCHSDHTAHVHSLLDQSTGC